MDLQYLKDVWNGIAICNKKGLAYWFGYMIGITANCLDRDDNRRAERRKIFKPYKNEQV